MPDVTIPFPQTTNSNVATTNMSNWDPEFAYQYGLYNGSTASNNTVTSWWSSIQKSLNTTQNILPIALGIIIGALLLSKRR